MVKEHIQKCGGHWKKVNNVTDEFIDPITIIDSNDKPMATIEEGDVIFFNFRTDRGRVNRVLTQWTCMNNAQIKLILLR
jgi:2,3-bisphosphoglycerate-independent phosphoglycerate mutase